MNPIDQRAKEAAEKELLYWKGVIRGARSELHEAGRISDDEYAELCQDIEARDYVDRIDVLSRKLDAFKAQRAEDVAAGEKNKRVMQQLGTALESMSWTRATHPHMWPTYTTDALESYRAMSATQPTQP